MVESFERGETEILVNLGCSYSQARVYLALNQSGASTIRSVSKATGIHRENLYKTIQSLIECGLIEKEIGSPAKYYTVPPGEVLPMLVTRKQAQVSKLKVETQTLIDRLVKKKEAPTTSHEDSGRFIVVSGRDIIIERLRKALDKTQITLDTVTTQKRFSEAIVEFSEGYQQALKRGVKVRLTTEKHTPEKTAREILKVLLQDPNFEVRFFNEPTKAIAAVFDGKEAHVSVSVNAYLSGAEGLWSNNSCFIALAQAYFDEKWASSGA